MQVTKLELGKAIAATRTPLHSPTCVWDAFFNPLSVFDTFF